MIGADKWPLFVNKQLFWWSASITLDNNNDVLTDFFEAIFLTSYLSWPDWLYFPVFFSFGYFDSFDHYAACWLPKGTKG